MDGIVYSGKLNRKLTELRTLYGELVYILNIFNIYNCFCHEMSLK